MNPNELVTISNKKTGAIKRVTRSELPNYGLPSDYVSKLDLATQAVQTGKMSLADVPSDQKAIVATSLPSDYKAPAQIAEEKTTNEVKDTIGNIDTVLGKSLTTVSGLGGVVGLVPGTKSYTTRGQIQQIKDQMSLASVGKLKGQGQVSDAERRLLANASSNIKFGMNPSDLRAELVKVKDILNRNIGAESTETPQVKDQSLAVAGVDALTNLLFPGVRKAFSAEGLATANPMDTSNVDLSKTKGNLGESLKAVGQNFLPSFSKYLSTVAPAGVEVGLAAQAIKGAPKVISGAKESVGKLGVKGASAARTKVAAESTAKLSGSNILKAGEEYVANDPTARKMLEKIAPTLQDQSMSATKLLDKLKIWNKAYTAAGRIGNSSKAGLYDVLSKAARDELLTKAPNVASAQTALAKAMGRSKIMSRIFNPVTIAGGAVTGGTFAALNKLLKIGQQ